MLKVKRICETCNNEFEADTREVNRGNGRFCSIRCAAMRPNPNRQTGTKVACAYCGKEFYKTPSKQAKSKSGLFFCCRAHKDAAQRIGGIKEIMPSHYGTGDGHTSYRKIAYDNFPHHCNHCGWNKYPHLLEVNHKDLNHSNNTIENLELLCPTCHVVFHFHDKSGKWTKKS